MPRPLVVLAAIPILAILLISILPSSFKDPYAWVDPIVLNSPAPNGRSRRWFNMGFWEDTGDFSDAAERLATKLIEFANARTGGAVLDIAHGSGESLLLHLAARPPPKRLDAIATLATDTARARSLVFSYKINNTITTPVEFYTGSAVPQLGKVDDQSHPLNPMRGFLGRSAGHGHDSESDSDYDTDVNQAFLGVTEPSTGYNLIYVLDAIYHFPPSLGSFLSIARKSLAPGGVIAYTDVLPPVSGLNPILARLISLSMGVPLPNLISRPQSLAAYRVELEELGFEGVEVVDWSVKVWPGFAENLKSRGGAWAYVGKCVDWAAKRDGWRFLAVRARQAE